jgi:F420-0:gamma-glutamyl ligase
MQRVIGTHARAVRAPIISQGDDLKKITVDCILDAAKNDGFSLKDHDIIGITESLLARSQGNFIDISEIAEEAANTFPDHFVVLFPILSRNRFSHILSGLAQSKRKITVMLSYPSDEVGNHLMDLDELYASNLNPHKDVLSCEEFRKIFGHRFKHPFTGLDYIDLYKDLAVDSNIEVVLANDSLSALEFSKDVLVATIHTRKHLKNLLLANGGNIVIGLDELATSPKKSGGYNPEFGLLGSNLAGDTRLKLFPRDAQQFCNDVQKDLFEKTGKTIEVLVYGDGAFKDPVGKIWELADPVVAPGYTSGLIGTPNEIKIKYIADNELVGLSQEEAQRQLKEKISKKGTNLLGQNASLGTTPRQLADLLGTLCDLMSGSGDKGTPIIHIQGYFDNFASD